MNFTMNASLGIYVRADDTNAKNGDIDLDGVDIWVAAPKNLVVWNLAGWERIVDGKQDFLNWRPWDTELGKWYTMRVLAEGNRFAMFIDDELIGDFRADIPEKGAVSVFAANVEVHFDNIVISGDEIPDINMGLPVEPKAKIATTWATIKQGR